MWGIEDLALGSEVEEVELLERHNGLVSDLSTRRGAAHAAIPRSRDCLSGRRAWVLSSFSSSQPVVPAQLYSHLLVEDAVTMLPLGEKAVSFSLKLQYFREGVRPQT